MRPADPWVLEAGPGVDLKGALASARRELGEGDRLSVLVSEEGVEPAVATLLEAGFALLDEGRESGRATLVARPDRVRCRVATAADLSSIDALFRASFGVERSAAAWRWRYEEGPAGRGVASVAVEPDAEAEGEGRVLAHYAGSPVRLHVDGRGSTLPALHIGDIMSARSARGRGLGAASVFGRVNRHFHAVHCHGRVGFNFGFNTATSRAFAIRFAGAVEAEPVPYWRREAGASESRRRYRVFRLESPTAELDRFFAGVARQYAPLFERSVAVVGWRYFRHPELRYAVYVARRWGRLRGWAVFRRDGERLLWGDALVDLDHPGAAAALLQAALEDAGPLPVEAWFPPRPAAWAEVLAGLGFRQEPEPRDLSLLTVPHLRPDSAELLRRSYYAMGDGDLF